MNHNSSDLPARPPRLYRRGRISLPCLCSGDACVALAAKPRIGSSAIALVLAGTVLLLTSVTAAQVTDPPSRPLLDQLNREAQSLYEEVQGGVIRVQLPTPKWMKAAAEGENPAHNWQLNPEVEQLLQEEQRKLEKGEQTRLQATVAPAARKGKAQENVAQRNAAPQPTSPWRVTQSPDGTTRLDSTGADGGAVIEIRTGGDVAGGGGLAPVGQATVTLRPASDFAPNNVGLLLDQAGHVLVPLFIEKEAIGEQGVRLSVGGGEPQLARFVGSDKQTNVTILKVQEPVGRPVRLSDQRPVDGSVVMVLSPNSGVGRLSLWTGGQQDYGVVVATDGSVAGFVRHGQFLSSAVVKPVLRQLIETGTVRRATLGVLVGEVPKQDPARLQIPELGSRPALRVTEVRVSSAADKGGLKEGDLILSVNGQAVGDSPTFGAVIAACSGKTDLKVLRDGMVMNITVELRPE